MNLLTNFYNPFFIIIITIQFQVYINIFLDKYTYKNIILYRVKLSPYVHMFVHEHIIMYEFDLFNNWAKKVKT